MILQHRNIIVSIGQLVFLGNQKYVVKARVLNIMAGSRNNIREYIPVGHVALLSELTYATEMVECLS